MTSRSNSSGQNVSLKTKIAEWYAHFKMRLASNGPQSFDNLFLNLEEYETYLGKYCGLPLSNAKVLEIGFGARPLRLIALISMGIDAQGVDLDQPLLHGTLGEFAKVAATNGFERTLKSCVRFAMFDRQERNALALALKKRGGWTMTIPSERFHICDATSEEFAQKLGNRKFDLIYSEDVFEHIPAAGLEPMLSRMATWLSPRGIVLIRPHIYSGIAGSHLPEWYPHTLNTPHERKSEPWEHLRQNRYQANTYLNRLWRSEYRALFSKFFIILEEKNTEPNLGRHFLTGKTAEDLKDVSEDDLFSNHILFVLQRRD